MHRVTGSGIERGMMCPASYAQPWANATTEQSTAGVGNHDAIDEGLVSGKTAALPDVVRAMLADDVTVDSEVTYVLNLRTRTARLLGRRLGRNYGKLEEYEIPLTLDAVFRGPVGVRVVDWKSRKRVTLAKSNWQIRAACLAVLAADALASVVGTIAYLDDGETDDVEFDAFDAAGAWEELTRMMAAIREVETTIAAGGVPSVHTGPWCAYCPALVHCPAQTRLALAMLGELETADDIVSTLSEEQAGHAWEKLKQIEALAERVSAALKARAKRSPLPLSNGKRLALIESSRSGLDTKKAKELLEAAGIAVPMKTSSFTSVREIRGLTLVTKNEGEDAA